MILADHSVICSLGGPLLHGSPVVVFFDHGLPRFWNFYSTIPVDVVRVKSYMNCLFDPKVGGSQKGYLLAMKRKKLIVRGNK